MTRAKDTSARRARSKAPTLLAAILVALVPSSLRADGGSSAPACEGRLDEPSAFRSSVESLTRACYANAYVRERSLESSMLDLEVRVRGTKVNVVSLGGSPSPAVERCVREGLRRLPVRADGGCVDQYFRVPLVAPRIPPPTTPATLADAEFALLAAVDTSGARLDELVDRRSAHVVPPSRLQRPSPVDLVNLWLVDASGGTSLELASPSVPASLRGDVARVWLYVRQAYGVAMTPEELAIVLRWDREDPVDEAERERDRRIRALQGTSNPFVGGAS